MADSIRDLMSSDLKTVEAGDSLVDAAREMRDADVGAIVVTDGEEFHGLLTDRDIAVRAVAEGKDPSETKVKEVATTDVATLEPDSVLEDAIRLMREHDVRRAPVLEDGKPVGIVSLGDLAVEAGEDSVLADISEAAPNN